MELLKQWELSLKIPKVERLSSLKRNLASDNRVVILISDAKGEFDNAELLICTSPLSQMIRKSLQKGMSQKEILGICAKLEIQVV
jgi:hypothetical protein